MKTLPWSSGVPWSSGDSLLNFYALEFRGSSGELGVPGSWEFRGVGSSGDSLLNFYALVKQTAFDKDMSQFKGV